jgi:hypothetical protein
VADNQDEVRWATAIAKLEAIDDKAGSLHVEMTRVREGLGHVERQISGVGAKLDSHIHEDDKRFESVVDGIRRVEDDARSPEGFKGKNAAMAGGGAGIVVLLEWIRRAVGLGPDA